MTIDGASGSRADGELWLTKPPVLSSNYTTAYIYANSRGLVQ